ncbi:MAG TPA: phosphoglucosamine mutase [Gammaproteobacteria bacterium]|nr:phosphoglucosamine mutase [Gammaproteobacteria bacterium]
MSTERKYFGTDGIRGQVGKAPITPDFVMRLGWAAGRILAQNGKGPVLIGKDTRISGYMFESALEAGLSAAGVDINLLGPMPTPGIAYLTKNTLAQAGIVISASHNPYQDNGIKFFSRDGRKLPDEIELAIERELEKPLEVTSPDKLGKAERINDARRRYIEFCKSKFKPDYNLSGFKLVIDCAHGATYQIAPFVYEELGADVVAIGAEPDGFNINKDSGATDTRLLKQKVIEENADAGIAYDGDGDRLIMVDHEGNEVDGDEILFIIAQSCPETLNGAVVGTLMSNLGLEQAIRRLNLDFLRTQVGDRYIMEMLLERDLILGGETSGHIIKLDLTTTGDGIISSLQILQAMLTSNSTLQRLRSGVTKFPQKMINVKLEHRVELSSLDGISDAVKSAESELGEDGRVLLRPSGTEPLIRVMVEGMEESVVENIARNLAIEVESAVQRSL